MALNKEIPQLTDINFNPILSRRRFLELVGKGVTYTTMIAAGKEIVSLGSQAHSENGIRVFPVANQKLSTLPPESFGIELFNVSQRFETTIAHRSGNTQEGIRKASSTGFSYADADILKSNGLYVSHDKEVEVFGIKPKLFQKPLIGPNSDNGSVRILHNPPTLESIIKTAHETGIGISAELKHGNFTTSDLQEIIRLQRIYGTNLMIHSQTPEIIEAGRKIDETHEANGNPIKWIIVPSVAGWNDAIKFSQGQENAGVLTNWNSANDRRELLKDSFVILGNIDTSDDVKKAAELEIVNGVMGEQRNLVHFLSS